MFSAIFLIFGLLLISGNCDQDIESNSQAAETDLFKYKSLDLDASRYHFYSSFDDSSELDSVWVRSKATKTGTKDQKYDGEWDITASHPRLKGDNALLLQSKAKHHALAAKFGHKYSFTKKNLVVQYEVQFREGQDCGGAYLKLLTAPAGDLKQIHDTTPYTIMFGPDKCGNERKLHFIFKHKNPLNGTVREIHLKKTRQIKELETVFKDGNWHLFRLTVRPDNSFEIQIDKKQVVKGNLLDDFEPPVNPPEEIDDPEDVKPDDWDEREKIPDPEAKKPDDWDESQPRQMPDPKAKKPSDWLDDQPEMVPDTSAVKPDDWDEDMDGAWEPPLIANPMCKSVSGCGKWKPPLVDNPKFKGKWKPALIKNPNYSGVWSPKKLPNPDYYNDIHPFAMNSIDAVAFELWSISSNIAFDNVLVTNDVDLANFVADSTFQLKKDIADAETENWFTKFVKDTNKKPWMWAVYLLGILIPFVTIGYFAVKPKKSPVAKSTPDKAQDDSYNPSGSDDEKDSKKKKLDQVDEEPEEEDNETETKPRLRKH